jgi:circadian clock protein KaiC
MSEKVGLERMQTGIFGLDDALGGGLPRGRTTLVVGGTGSGKTILAAQMLAQGARLGESGVFLTFEESPRDILANMAAFTWAPSGRTKPRLSIMDGRAVRTAFRNGSFDLVALLSVVGHRCRRMKARRIVFDSLDVLLDMIDDPAVMRREVYRLSDWLAEQGLTAIITAKRQPDDETLPSRYAFLPFLTDCVLVLQHRVVGRTASRALRILKCRGVAHSSNEMPMLLSDAGLEVVAPRTREMVRPIFSERISSGVGRLDTMLDGGYVRGTSTLVSGAAGTGKTSLAGTFVEAACRRGERALFATFDEAGDAIVRNLSSVNIRLGTFVRSGLLRVVSMPASGMTPEAHTLRISTLLKQHQARSLVLDPISALIHPGASEFAADAVLGLLDLAKRRGITVLVTSLLDDADLSKEDKVVGISTVVDTWMRLSYVAAAGERNRALNIVKSRGTGHSNQVRELILSSHGLSLVDVYTAGGAVLMGTLRRQKEEQERAEKTGIARAEEVHHDEITAGIAEAQGRIAALQSEVARKKTDLRLQKERAKAGAAVGAENLAVRRRLRGADVAPGRGSGSAVKRSARKTR